MARRGLRAGFAAPVALRGGGGARCAAAAAPRCGTRPPRMCDAEVDPADCLAPGEVLVRFVNGPGGADVLTPATPGENLLRVGDSGGVTIPRACQTGLCGSCTSDVVGVDGETEVVRACQTGVYVAEGSREMVVDVWRVGESRAKGEVNPMARFDNLDTEYVAGAAPRKGGVKRKLLPRDCSACGATGDIVCYNCDGSGVVKSDASYDCPLCMGSRYTRCAPCQGSGTVMG